MRIDNRKYNELRNIEIIRDFTIHPEGSILISWGNTKVICNATVEEGVPSFLKDSGRGWVTAEYSMLPRATNTRNTRDIKRLRENSRAVEISRLIGRSLRMAVDMEKLGENTIIIDCDVIQADGGTRTASITGGFVALYDACNYLVKEEIIEENPVKTFINAVSVGIVKGKPLLDLCYEEDRDADVDFNIIMDSKGNYIELQGTGEENVFSKDDLLEMLDLGDIGSKEIVKIQKEALGL